MIVAQQPTEIYRFDPEVSFEVFALFKEEEQIVTQISDFRCHCIFCNGFIDSDAVICIDRGNICIECFERGFIDAEYPKEFF